MIDEDLKKAIKWLNTPEGLHMYLHEIGMPLSEEDKKELEIARQKLSLIEGS